MIRVRTMIQLLFRDKKFLIFSKIIFILWRKSIVNSNSITVYENNPAKRCLAMTISDNISHFLFKQYNWITF